MAKYTYKSFGGIGRAYRKDSNMKMGDKKMVLDRGRWKEAGNVGSWSEGKADKLKRALISPKSEKVVVGALKGAAKLGTIAMPKSTKSGAKMGKKAGEALSQAMEKAKKEPRVRTAPKKMTKKYKKMLLKK